ncbi:hypothetical protein N7509_007908 [Penicillium cosmopolitanum]|uniref:CDP-diglyceride hydrolase n=1 Tax=Penicillium cosmopolitanum TaxID=1131564 RepID=A0A9W9VZS2_9EURO|nr:uncharacterized protein N7509_007908 [Penicillium cosmopolitanum]KAJ5392418.1 hypothetical protein N7509_007908 [Penicillium cosmopolitanum]
MTFYIRLYFTIALLLRLSFAQGPPPTNSRCHSDWIDNDNVGGTCKCELGDLTKCSQSDLGTCNGRDLLSASELMTGHETEGCTEANAGCDSCFLWFDKVCNCLKDGCPDSPATHSWIRLPDGKITSKRRMAGILELSSEEPWEWGQSIASPEQVLVINSVKARKQEQIHMHVCEARTGKPGGVRELLGGLQKSDYGTLKQVKNQEDWWCRAQSSPNTHITNVISDIKSKVTKNPGCSNLIGAAVLTDSTGYKWVCLTTGLGSTQGQFCAANEG